MQKTRRLRIDTSSIQLEIYVNPTEGKGGDTCLNVVSSVDATDAEGDGKNTGQLRAKQETRKQTDDERTDRISGKRVRDRERRKDERPGGQTARGRDRETERDTEREEQGPPEAEMSSTENWLHIERRRST